MEPKKRKRDVGCPRITYDTSTKVFDRLFKEESLEEMKNVVRKKLGLSSSHPLHLSQLRDGKPIVLEDDDDFDAFYASIHSTAVAKILVYLGDDQPIKAGPDAGFTGGPMQILGSPAIHHAAADGPSSSKKRKITFVEPTPQPADDNVEKPDLSQSLPNPEPPPEVPATLDVTPTDVEGAHETSEQPVGDDVKEPDSNQSLPNPEPLPEVPATLDVISTDTEGAHETSERPVGDNVEEPNSNQSLPNSEPLPEVPATLDVISADAADTQKGPEESQHHTPSIGRADSSGVDVSTRPPKVTRKNQNRMEVVIVSKESSAALSAPISTSSSVVQRAKKQDPKPPASISALQTIPSDSKGKTKKLGRSLTSPTILTLNKLTKKSRKSEVPVEPLEANDKGQMMSSATRVAVDAILGKILSSDGSMETPTRSSPPLVDATAPSPSIAPAAPVTSPDDQPVPSKNTNTITGLKTSPKCPVCNKTPYHFRSRCPIIRGGPKSMLQRIAQLQQDTSDGNEEEREKVIEELQRIIDKRTNQTPARENKSTNAISMAKKSVIPPADTVDELRSSSDTPLPPARRPVPPAVVNGVSNELDPLFLHSESQQSFPYSQYPNLQPPESEDEEDELQSSAVKSQTTTKSSSKFRSLTEIASQATLFTPTIPLTQKNGTKEVTNLYGRSNKEDDSEDSDSDSETESDEAKAQTSHIPLSRRAGILLSKRR